MATILIPGEQHRAGPVIAGRSSSMAGLAADTRTWMQRARDSLAYPCPGCGVNPIPVVRFDVVGNAAQCQCSTMVALNVSVPATRPVSAREKAASAQRKAQLAGMTKRRR